MGLHYNIYVFKTGTGFGSACIGMTCYIQDVLVVRSLRFVQTHPDTIHAKRCLLSVVNSKLKCFFFFFFCSVITLKQSVSLTDGI